MQLFLAEISIQKKLRYEVTFSRDIVDQRILQFDWGRDTPSQI